MNAIELYEQKKRIIEKKIIDERLNENPYTKDNFNDKEDFLLPLFIDEEINNTELKTYYFTKVQIALIDFLATRNFKKQSEFLRNLVNIGLSEFLLSSSFSEQEKEEYATLLTQLVDKDLLEKESTYRNKQDS